MKRVSGAGKRSSVGIIEGDVFLQRGPQPKPMMRIPPEGDSLTFRQWLERIPGTGKGIALPFAPYREPCCEMRLGFEL